MDIYTWFQGIWTFQTYGPPWSQGIQITEIPLYYIYTYANMTIHVHIHSLNAHMRTLILQSHHKNNNYVCCIRMLFKSTTIF